MHVDLLIFQAVNGWCGTSALDLPIVLANRLAVLKGGITMAVFWWFWQSGDSVGHRQEIRRIIITTIVGTFLAIVVARAMTVMLPFRARPLYTSGIGYHAPSIPIDLHAENWSSFPSDHAAMWFALTFGVWRLSRPVGIIAAIYSTLWICLIRLYLGIHYPSDLLGGALTGLASGWVATRLPLSRPITHLLGWEATAPTWFYAGAFLVTYETADIFDDVRKVMHGLHMVHAFNPTLIVIGGGTVLLLTGLALLGAVARREAHVNRTGARADLHPEPARMKGEV